MKLMLHSKRALLGAALASLLLAAACGDSGETSEPSRSWECVATGEDFDSLPELGCQEDFDQAATEPTDSSLPGARTVKTLVDRVDDGALYFLDTEKYPLHFTFASEHLSAKGDLPVIASQVEFNDNYFSAQRRFYLGAVTYYEGPEKWVYEISPYDTASAEMIEEQFVAVRDATFFGEELYFHPTGDAVERAAAELPDSIPLITTEEIYAGTDYQALNLGSSCGRLVFLTVEELETEHVSYQDIVVLDSAPNDISVAQGIITDEFQTPLSHVNVLSRNRGTPNMALRGATQNEALRALEGQWVSLTVGAFDYSVAGIDASEAEACLIKPEPIDIHDMDLEVTELADIETLYDPESDLGLREQVSSHVPAYGGKASHYGPLSHVPEANAPKAFAIPVYYYDQFMKENGFAERVAGLLADEAFMTDADVRDAALEQLRADMMLAPINADFWDLLVTKLEADYPGIRMRFRSSTNAEDLGDFTGAGLYTSQSGTLGDPEESVEDAIREVWSSVWYFRAFEEREYNGIDHRKVGMALLVHNSFPDEEANGVAITANPFDTAGVEPGFYVNVQKGESSVVQPPRGITTDQFIYYYSLQGQPVVYLQQSNLVADGERVLTPTQIHDLGVGLEAVHQFFYPAYGENSETGWYAMDVEFKFDAPEGETPVLRIKQARPYPAPKVIAP